MQPSKAHDMAEKVNMYHVFEEGNPCGRRTAKLQTVPVGSWCQQTRLTSDGLHYSY